jgi:hypothetical protein
VGRKAIQLVMLVISIFIFDSCKLINQDKKGNTLIEVSSHGEVFNREAGEVMVLENSVIIYSDSSHVFYLAPLVQTFFRKKNSN